MFRIEAPSLSNPQNTSSPTFQVPSWSTEVPVAPLATVVPAAERSYFTFAWLDDVTVTESTLEVTADASGLAENAASAEVNSEPFSSSWTRSLFGVEELKNFSQLAVICETAEPLAAGAAVVAGAEVAGAEVAGAELELEPLLEHAVATASIRPSAGIR
ncbi:MAG TPA: hypothetical protein VMG13_24595 [Trebonia sp.]|nr:hypothetical protein [Trebonia sp.]